MAIFCGYYGVARFASDSLRVNDERVLGLTGAQYLCLAMLPAPAPGSGSGCRKQLAGDIAAGMPVGVEPAEPENAEADATWRTNALRERACAVRRVAVRSA